MPLTHETLYALCLDDMDRDLVTLDRTYIDHIFTQLKQNESLLLGVVERLAPKFSLDTMPRIHLLIILIALTEMLYWKGGDIDMKVSVNEAVELAKEFTDTQGKNFINGVLATFVRDIETYRKALTPSTTIYTIFHNE